MIVAVVGADGAGKSTATRLATELLRDRGDAATTVGRWDIVGDDRYPAARFMQASVEETRQCVAEMPRASRFLFLMWSMGYALEARPPEPGAITVLDGYWMKHAASEIAYGVDREWIESVVAGLPRADTVVYLRVTPDVAWERKKDGEVEPYECGMDPSCSRAAFVAHQTRILTTMDAWAERHGWSVVDGSGDPDASRRAIVACLDRTERPA
ncbi:thymidylate kinase [Clavibacter sp. VKM Ac-2873]|uniref:dTMP kinase n=1 Tax=Clavibacter sp. VKM Ac-2873 TaxID=2783813 RepID=UPI00188CA21F|nr:thymidylate kinase [Clavibacter sp. VKM Ac-2873]MBF4619273.1 thymidylate kinase [Clavibacter sp. VKM Ac-2873]